MSSSTTPVSCARVYARTQYIALASNHFDAQEDLVRVAFSQEGAVLLGENIPPALDPRRISRLLLGTQHCYLALEGITAEYFNESDAQRWKALHPGEELSWRLEPEVILWSRFDYGLHAFDATEWNLEPIRGLSQESDFIEHLNTNHARLIAAITRESSDHACGLGARVMSIDPEGLLVEVGGDLRHVAFAAPCHTSHDLQRALQRLADQTPRGTRHTHSAKQAAPHTVLPGGRADSGSVRSEGRLRSHGCPESPPPGIRLREA